MKIGLLGFGVVGRGVYDITKTRNDMSVATVVCLEDITLPDVKVTKDFRDILEDPTIDTVVEAMGGVHPAYEFVRSAMEAGKNIVTSNKALVATCYEQLLSLAQEKGLQLRCTAAVGGGIGWLTALERSRRVQKLNRVGGIMNGTCNYILDSMTRLGLGYDEALKQAQTLGYAEANPSTDVDGIDTWHKLLLSANVAFGIRLDPATVPAAGIRHITAGDVKQFAAHGYVCKLMSSAVRTEHGCSAMVQPTLLKQGALEAAVPSNYNLITYDGEYSGIQSYYGQGAGRYPTAYNVVLDCADLLEGAGFYVPLGSLTPAENTAPMRYYIRSTAAIPWQAEQIWGDGIVTGPVSPAQVHGWLKENPGSFIAGIPEEN